MYYSPTLLPLLLNSILITNDSFIHNQLFEKVVCQRSGFLDVTNKTNGNLMTFRVFIAKEKILNVETITKFL